MAFRQTYGLSSEMIRTLLMLGFWAMLVPIAALFCFPWVLITGDIGTLYRIGMWGAKTGVRIAGVRVRIVGLEHLDQKKTYIFLSNRSEERRVGKECRSRW